MDLRDAMVAALLLALPASALAQATAVVRLLAEADGSVEKRICQDPKLAALDRQLADAYKAAQAKAERRRQGNADCGAARLDQEPQRLLEGRPTCQPAWQASYRDRISELQAQYRLIAPVGTGRYLCQGPPRGSWWRTSSRPIRRPRWCSSAAPRSSCAIARSGSGARYTGGNRQFWEHQGVATLNARQALPRARSCAGR